VCYNKFANKWGELPRIYGELWRRWPTSAKAMVGKENFTSPPLFRTKTFTDKQETKKQRKTVDTEELKKVLEETIRK